MSKIYDPTRIVATDVNLLIEGLKVLRFSNEGRELLRVATNANASYMKAGWAVIHFSSRMTAAGMQPCLVTNLRDETGMIPRDTIEAIGASLQDFFNLKVAETVVDSYTAAN